jgi:hypothetical protein
VDMVLGLSVTPTTVGFVLVEGRDAGGATLDRDAFDVRATGGVTAVAVSEHVATAMLRTEAVAAAGNHRLASIGVTWSDEADWEGSVLLESLVESGIDNVVAVGLPEATEALARGISHVVDYRKTAVCVVEPGAVMALAVDSRHGGVQTVVNHAINGDAALVRWLSTVLPRHDWRPDGLVVVGSGLDIDALTARLDRHLPLPVIAPADAELALARGAALASAHDDEWADLDLRAAPPPPAVTHRRRMPLPYLGALTMLVAGALTFVVSVSLAVGLKLTADSNPKPAEHRPVSETAGTPALVQAVAPPAAPPIADVPPPAAEPPPPAPPPDAAPVVDAPEAPPPEAAPDDQPPAGAPPPDVPAAVVPPPVQPTTPTVPPADSDQGTLRDHSPLLTKILEHLPGLHRPPSEQSPESADQLAPPAPPSTDTPPPPPG